MRRARRVLAVGGLAAALLGVVVMLGAVLVLAQVAGAAGWHGAVRLSAGGEAADSPRLAFDGSGSAVAIWRSAVEERFGTRHELRAAYRDAGSGVWRQPVALGQEAVGLGRYSVVFDRRGNALVAWWGGADGLLQPFAAFRSAESGRWEQRVRLSLPDSGWYSDRLAGSPPAPVIGLDRKGNALVLWVSRDESGQQQLRASFRSATAAAWTRSERIGEPVARVAHGPRLSFDAAGGALVVWASGEAANSTLRSATRSAKGAWTAPVDLPRSGDHTGTGAEGALFSDAGDKPQLVWSEGLNATRTSWLRFASLLPTRDGWSDPIDLSPSSAWESIRDWRVASDVSGNAVLVWSSDGTLFAGVWARSYRASTGTWAPAVRLGGGFPLGVAVDGGGQAVALWAEYLPFPTDEDVVVMASVRDPASDSWGPAVALDEPQKPTGLVALQADGQGGFHAAWSWREDYGPPTALRVSKLRNGHSRWTRPDDLLELPVPPWRAPYDLSLEASPSTTEHVAALWSQGRPASSSVHVAFYGEFCTHQILGTRWGDVLSGTGASELIRGGSGNDRLRGRGEDDCLHGNGGDDRLLGQAGNDRLRGHAGADVLIGGAGRDRLRGDRGADRLLGGSADDTLHGNAGADTLGGGAGSDELVGGRGRDILAGGRGNDRIDARDGMRDRRINCGPGQDVLLADPLDTHVGCERVRIFPRA